MISFYKVFWKDKGFKPFFLNDHYIVSKDLQKPADTNNTYIIFHF